MAFIDLKTCYQKQQQRLSYKSKFSALTEEVKTQQFEYYVTKIKQSNINVHKMLEIIVEQKTYKSLIIITLLDVIDGIILQKFQTRNVPLHFFVEKKENQQQNILKYLLKV